MARGRTVLEAQRIHPGLWRADQVGHATVAARSSRFAALDRVLPGGGWPLGMLTELLARNPGVGELRLLIPLLRQLTSERKVVLMLAPPLIPYGPALAAYGIDLDYLLIIQAPNAADRLWAVEQTLKSTSFGALLAWLPQDRTRPEHLRRMQLAAQSCRGPVFLFRELAAQHESSPAPLRLMLLPRPGQVLAVQLLKRRGPVLAEPVLLTLPQPPLSLRLRALPGSPAMTTEDGSAEGVIAEGVIAEGGIAEGVAAEDALAGGITAGRVAAGGVAGFTGSGLVKPLH